ANGGTATHDLSCIADGRDEASVAPADGSDRRCRWTGCSRSSHRWKELSRGSLSEPPPGADSATYGRHLPGNPSDREEERSGCLRSPPMHHWRHPPESHRGATKSEPLAAGRSYF